MLLEAGACYEVAENSDTITCSEVGAEKIPRPSEPGHLAKETSRQTAGDSAWLLLAAHSDMGERRNVK